MHQPQPPDPSTRAPDLAGGSRSGFRPTGVVEGATGLPVGLHANKFFPPPKFHYLHFLPHRFFSYPSSP